MKIISRAEAKALGLKRFFTGRPCIRGHIAERIVSNKACFECAAMRDRAYKASHKDLLREKSRLRNAGNKEYSRQYYLKNKEKYKDRSDRRYHENREEILARQRERAANNPDLIANKNKKYRANNPDKVVEVQRKNYLKNRERILQRHRENHQADPSKARAKVALRRSRKLMAVPGWYGELDSFVWSEAADLACRREHATGFAWASDHMIALAGRKVCGLHAWNNCQVIPAQLNLWKNNKMVLTEPGEWILHLSDQISPA